MFKFDNCMLPEIFDIFYKKHKEVHKYPTRSSENLYIPKIRTNAYRKTMKYIGVSVWNYLFNKTDHNCNLVLFKRRLRKYLLFNDISM